MHRQFACRRQNERAQAVVVVDSTTTLDASFALRDDAAQHRQTKGERLAAARFGGTDDVAARLDCMRHDADLHRRRLREAKPRETVDHALMKAKVGPRRHVARRHRLEYAMRCCVVDNIVVIVVVVIGIVVVVYLLAVVYLLVFVLIVVVFVVFVIFVVDNNVDSASSFLCI